MSSAATIRLQIESALAQKIPSALTPRHNTIRPVAATGIGPLDDLLRGGLPVGAISELVGPECSGRTGIALSFLARLTAQGKVCAWIDASNAFDPVSAAAVGVDLARLLWVRCGVDSMVEKPVRHRFVLPDKYLIPPTAKKGLHGGGFGTHPRNEEKGLSDAVGNFFAPRCAEPQHKPRPQQQTFAASYRSERQPRPRAVSHAKPWSRLEQAMKSADLLLQAGGFSALVFDMGSLTPEYVSRIPLATWFRYRAAADRTQASILLLAQYACAKSSAELLLRLESADEIGNEATVFTGIRPQAEIVRRRFVQAESNVVPLRKPPQHANATRWESRTAWSGRR